MLHYAVVFFVIALIAAVLRLRGIAGLFAEIGGLFPVLSIAFLAVALVSGTTGCAARSTQAGDPCFYRGTQYSDGAAACQAGAQYRCTEGDWKSLGIACTEPPLVASEPCRFGGISFSAGSASCQAGTQFRCGEDGVWRSLGIACAVGDSPIRVLPSGRTCMFGDVTVANNSTVCKSGTTFLCSDGEWVSLGTLCR